MVMSRKSVTTAILILALLAIAVSAYLTYLHYAPGHGAWCDVSQGFNCEIVNQSIYAEFPPGSGIPVGGLGALAFIIVFILAYSVQKKEEFLYFDRKERAKYLAILLGMSVLFSLYLVYIEAFVLYTFCLFCLILGILIIASFILALKLKSLIV